MVLAAVARKTSVKVTNPERVIEPSPGFKEVDLVRHYESMRSRSCLT